MTYPTPKPGTGLNTIAFDLDGTLAEPTWPSPEIGQPIASAVDALKHYAGKGFEIIIYTSRPKSHTYRIGTWLARNEIGNFVYDIITDKPRAAMYVDDRAVSFPFEEPKPCPRFHEDDAGQEAASLKEFQCAAPLVEARNSTHPYGSIYYCVNRSGHNGRHNWQGNKASGLIPIGPPTAIASDLPHHDESTCSVCAKQTAPSFSTWGGKLE